MNAMAERRRCCVASCVNNENPSKIAMHRLPDVDPGLTDVTARSAREELRTRWLQSVQADADEGASLFVCARHFPPNAYDCVELDRKKVRRLKPDVVPTMFLPGQTVESGKKKPAGGNWSHSFAQWGSLTEHKENDALVFENFGRFFEAPIAADEDNRSTPKSVSSQEEQNCAVERASIFENNDDISSGASAKSRLEKNAIFEQSSEDSSRGAVMDVLDRVVSHTNLEESKRKAALSLTKASTGCEISKDCVGTQATHALNAFEGLSGGEPETTLDCLSETELNLQLPEGSSSPNVSVRDLNLNEPDLFVGLPATGVDQPSLRNARTLSETGSNEQNKHFDEASSTLTEGVLNEPNRHSSLIVNESLLHGSLPDSLNNTIEKTGCTLQAKDKQHDTSDISLSKQIPIVNSTDLDKSGEELVAPLEGDSALISNDNAGSNVSSSRGCTSPFLDCGSANAIKSSINQPGPPAKRTKGCELTSSEMTLEENCSNGVNATAISSPNGLEFSANTTEELPANKLGDVSFDINLPKELAEPCKSKRLKDSQAAEGKSSPCSDGPELASDKCAGASHGALSLPNRTDSNSPSEFPGENKERKEGQKVTADLLKVGSSSAEAASTAPKRTTRSEKGNAHSASKEGGLIPVRRSQRAAALKRTFAELSSEEGEDDFPEAEAKKVASSLSDDTTKTQARMKYSPRRSTIATSEAQQSNARKSSSPSVLNTAAAIIVRDFTERLARTMAKKLMDIAIEEKSRVRLCFEKISTLAASLERINKDITCHLNTCKYASSVRHVAVQVQPPSEQQRAALASAYASQLQMQSMQLNQNSTNRGTVLSYGDVAHTRGHQKVVSGNLPGVRHGRPQMIAAPGASPLGTSGALRHASLPIVPPPPLGTRLPAANQRLAPPIINPMYQQRAAGHSAVRASSAGSGGSINAPQRYPSVARAPGSSCVAPGAANQSVTYIDLTDDESDPLRAQPSMNSLTTQVGSTPGVRSIRGANGNTGGALRNHQAAVPVGGIVSASALRGAISAQQPVYQHQQQHTLQGRRVEPHSYANAPLQQSQQQQYYQQTPLPQQRGARPLGPGVGMPSQATANAANVCLPSASGQQLNLPAGTFLGPRGTMLSVGQVAQRARLPAQQQRLHQSATLSPAGPVAAVRGPSPRSRSMPQTTSSSQNLAGGNSSSNGGVTALPHPAVNLPAGTLLQPLSNTGSSNLNVAHGSGSHSSVQQRQSQQSNVPTQGAHHRRQSSQRPKHPAPLPVTPTYVDHQILRTPPAPVIQSIKKETKGIVVTFDVKKEAGVRYAETDKYQVFSYVETEAPPATENWNKVGEVNALRPPMACTFTQFRDGHRIFFAVRGVDVQGRLGAFTEPKFIDLRNNVIVL